MRILFVDVVYGSSSTGKIVKDLSDAFEAKGHTTFTAFGRGNDLIDLKSQKISSDLEVYTHAALTRITGLTGYFSPFSTQKLINLIETFKPDIVHLHEIHGYFLNINQLCEFLKLKKIRTLWTFHSEFMYTGKCGHAFECNKWQTECMQCPQVHEYPSSILFDFTKKMFNDKKSMFKDFEHLRITTPSKWLADRVKDSFLAEREIKVIHNGIDTERVFFRRDTGTLKKSLGITSKYIVVSIGPDLMSDQKGGKHTLKIAELMKNEDVTFVMVGVNKPQEIDAPNIISIGKIYDQNELAKYFSLGNIFLLTSKKETFSLVCAESLACGVPVVGFNAGAPVEVAPDGYGKFVEYGNVDKVAKTLINSLKQPDLFKSSNDCIQYARDNFSNSIMVNNYEEVYSDMLKS